MNLGDDEKYILEIFRAIPVPRQQLIIEIAGALVAENPGEKDFPDNQSINQSINQS